MTSPKANEIYRHFKGNLYKILALAKDSETLEEVVVYQALYGEFQVYVRTLSMFMEPVEQKMRFELVSTVIIPEKPESRVLEPQIETEQEDDVPHLEPLVLEFFDADTYEEKLNILAALHHKITDDMISMLAVSMDMEIAEGELEERFEALKNCLLTLEKYECSRMR